MEKGGADTAEGIGDRGYKFVLNQALVLQLLKLIVQIVWDLLVCKSTFPQSVEYKWLACKNYFLLAYSM